MNRNGDKFDRWIVTSAVLHSLVFTLVIFSPTLFPMRGDANWGTNTRQRRRHQRKDYREPFGRIASLARGGY